MLSYVPQRLAPGAALVVVPLSELMIQTTNRLSRGARLRRGSPMWKWIVLVGFGLVVCGLGLFLNH